MSIFHTWNPVFRDFQTYCKQRKISHFHQMSFICKSKFFQSFCSFVDQSISQFIISLKSIRSDNDLKHWGKRRINSIYSWILSLLMNDKSIDWSDGKSQSLKWMDCITRGLIFKYLTFCPKYDFISRMFSSKLMNKVLYFTEILMNLISGKIWLNHS